MITKIKQKLLNFTKNKDLRHKNDIIKYLIIHHTAWHAPWDFNMLSWRNPNSKVSVHYYIGKDGIIWALVWENYIARHTGKSNIGPKEQTRWGWNLNPISVWIELENYGNWKDPYTKEQIESLKELSLDIIKRNNIKIENVLWHKEITTNKIDPSSNFFAWDMDWFRKYLKKQIEIKEKTKENNTKIIKEINNKQNKKDILKQINDNKDLIKLLFNIFNKMSIKKIAILILITILGISSLYFINKYWIRLNQDEIIKTIDNLTK